MVDRLPHSGHSSVTQGDLTVEEIVAHFWTPSLPDYWVGLDAAGQLWMWPDIPAGRDAARPYRASWRTLRASRPGMLALQRIGLDRERERDILLSASQAANILGVSPQRIYQLIAEKRLPSWRIGTDRVVRTGDLDAVRDRVRTGRPKNSL